MHKQTHTTGDRPLTNRTTIKNVTIPRSFKLRGMLDDELPAGTYAVETDEELIELLTFSAYRRTETRMYLPSRPGGHGCAQVVFITPDELDGAMGAPKEPAYSLQAPPAGA